MLADHCSDLRLRIGRPGESRFRRDVLSLNRQFARRTRPLSEPACPVADDSLALGRKTVSVPSTRISVEREEVFKRAAVGISNLEVPRDVSPHG